MKALFVSKIKRDQKFWNLTPNFHFSQKVRNEMDRRVFEFKDEDDKEDFSELFYNLGRCRAAAAKKCGDRTCLKKFFSQEVYTHSGIEYRIYACDSEGRFKKLIGRVIKIFGEMYFDEEEGGEK